MLYNKRREKRNQKNGRGLIKSEDCKNKKDKKKINENLVRLKRKVAFVIDWH